MKIKRYTLIGNDDWETNEYGHWVIIGRRSDGKTWVERSTDDYVLALSVLHQLSDKEAARIRRKEEEYAARRKRDEAKISFLRPKPSQFDGLKVGDLVELHTRSNPYSFTSGWLQALRYVDAVTDTHIVVSGYFCDRQSGFCYTGMDGDIDAWITIPQKDAA